MTRQVLTIETHKDRSGWGVILVAAVAMACQKFIILVAVFALCFWAGWKLYQTYADHRGVKIARDAALARSADYQNRLAIAGDPLGYEGDYPCATMPITREQMTIKWDPTFHFNLDDYDDGLRAWK
jgi:hypothetical protein